ncbi:MULTISPECIES: sporulation integral membrane protein YtvI [unclassified Bacillus (in: firmicutes)]|uniref:sporulation integral membrane protein YtvI n=1 Tax=unclassified Bacillus (in: firmicutes) TaxID=185979 RepID=UPI0008E88CF9|nr:MULTISPECIES: sporulation integral membrane protein YtvI [unclassified Bacillus (in: firmicutes)]SFA77670.1 sporulation integral membrane protein YtvI [Bacillus sp. UNCCL13]SFQ67593.1 sporulation integral membrane protein YtvI [Bacillus sp. cl95]
MWKKWLTIVGVILLFIFFIPYSLPIVFALVTAMLLEGVVHYFQRVLRLSRVKAVIASFLTYIAALIIIGYNLFLIIFQQTVKLSENTPSFVKDLYASAIKPLIKKWESYSKTLPDEVILSLEETLEKTFMALDSFLQGTVAFLVNLLTAIPGFLIEFLVYLIALFLISIELPEIKKRIKERLTVESQRKFSIVINQLTQAGFGFIKAQIILSLLTFVLAFVGLSILGAPYTSLISLLIVVVDILPILGTGSVLVPWAVVSLLQNNQFLGVGLIIMFVVITVVRRIIEPKVFSTNLGISPLASLVSLYIGFKLFGFIGLFAGPALVIIFDALVKVNVIRLNFKI